MKPNYGLDAPIVLFALFFGSLASLLLALLTPIYLERVTPFSKIIEIQFFLGAIVMGFEILLMVYSSKRGKRKCLQNVVENLNLQGQEHILDIGCGRGIFAIEAAKKLQEGKVTGIDIWQRKDQWGSSLQNAKNNADIENVKDRILFQTANMCALPFEKEKFDVALASLAIHNLKSKKERHLAIQEISRVLKPKGKLIIVDFRAFPDYLEALQELGWKNITISKRNFQIFPYVRILSAQKP